MTMESSDKFGASLRELVLKEAIDRPLIFRGIHKNWEPCKWTLDEWGELFKNEKLSIRYGKQKWDSLQPQWESDCGKDDLSWKEIMDWMNGEHTFLPENGSPDDIWVYYDYKYLPDVFQLKGSDGKDFLKLIYFNESLKKKFSWSKLGFPDRDADQSTLWCGSAGSYTPCHFDTYSCNLVCQVYGRKSWLLFPPRDLDHLEPTRVPYEESSVYSRINFASEKRIQSHIQDLQKCSPLKVTLEAGDCLYLPPKWWHYVRSEDFSISVNTWIELPGDHSTRVEEAILRSLTSSVVSLTFPETAQRLLNPNEIDLTEFSESDVNELLEVATSKFLETQSIKVLASSELDSQEPDKFSEGGSPPNKRCRLSDNYSLEDFLMTYSNLIETPQPYSWNLANPSSGTVNSFDSLETKEKQAANGLSKSSPTYIEHLINAVGHPTILKMITNQFIRNVTSLPPK